MTFEDVWKTLTFFSLQHNRAYHLNEILITLGLFFRIRRKSVEKNVGLTDHL